MRAWRTVTEDGEPTVCIQNKRPLSISEGDALLLPCGRCLGCQLAHRQAWALRCQLETQRHHSTAFATLTYDQDNVPLTLSRADLSAFIKRLRSRLSRSASARNLRFYAAGEYGETTSRPHYHAILYGLSKADEELIHTAWGLGLTKTDAVTPARIAYCAGYVQKKLGHQYWPETTINPFTGERITFQPPFTQMSRRPGIAGHAREHIQSWRLYAIYNGQKTTVPRFLHQAWKQQATLTEEEKLETEKREYLLTRHQNTFRNLQALEKIAETNQRLTADKRRAI